MLSRYLTGCILVAVVAFVLGGLPTASVAASSDTGNARVLRLYFQVQQLKDRVRHLQGEIQSLKHRVAQNRKLQKKNYQSLLKRLNGGAKGSSSANAQSTSGQQAAKTTESKPTAGGPSTGSSNNPSSGGKSSEGGNQQQSSGSSLHEQYMAAFDLLKNGKYNKAAAAFLQFAHQHPDGGLTDNAYYWRGEALYVQQKYEKARKTFVKVVNNFPNSAKMPDSLYKLALLDIRNGHPDNAKAVLNRITDQYSNSRAARLAQKKLEQLGS